MKPQIRQQLENKNQNLINMVLEKTKRDLVEDIAIIGLTGSFSRDDFHEKSDLDLIIINDTDKGWEIGSCFILDDVGYDIYCTPWHSRLKEQSNLESFAAGSLIDLEIIYYKNDESLKRFKTLQQIALDKLSKPIGKECLDRADKTFEKAKIFYADLFIEDQLNTIRYASSNMLFELINTLVNINNTYIKRGTIHYLEELNSYKHIPNDFESMYLQVITSKDISEIRETSHTILLSIAEFLKTIKSKYIEQPKVSYDNLNGVYEELWCNCRNKIIRSASMTDFNYAIHAARGAQEFLNDLHNDIGTQKYDLMKYFDAHNMTPIKDRFLEIMKDFKETYDNTGRKVLHYNNFEELYNDYMKK
ncbi:MAG: nucleotidyltransferase domain-containing protein [Clostridiales bacterium]|nr:nucleotidyltransferase domain-containing protein [Clostridiales bacterium]